MSKISSWGSRDDISSGSFDVSNFTFDDKVINFNYELKYSSNDFAFTNNWNKKLTYRIWNINEDIIDQGILDLSNNNLTLDNFVYTLSGFQTINTNLTPGEIYSIGFITTVPINTERNVQLFFFAPGEIPIGPIPFPPLIDISGTFDVYDKQYDGTVEAEVSGAVVVNGKVEGDDVQILITKAEFVDPNVEENKVVWAKEYGLTGTSASKYNLVTIYPTLASITPRLLSASIQLNLTPKVYDGSSSLNLNQVNISDVSGIVSTDDVQVTVLGASFENANAGIGKSLNVQLGLTGAHATKYTIDSSANITGTISPKLLDVTIANSGSKPYDATSVVSASVVSAIMADPSQIISGDTVYVDVSSATFNDANAESNKPLNIVLKLTGSDADNYDVNGGKSVYGQTASITPKELTVTITSAPSKTFDGNQTVTDISAILFRVDGPVNGETPNVKIDSATYDRIIGGNLSATFSVLDTNYSISSPTVFANYDLQAIIYPKNIDISFSVLPKIYDGNSNVDLSDVTIEYIGVLDGFPVSQNLIGANYSGGFSPGNWNVLLGFTDRPLDSYYIMANQFTGNFQGEILPKSIDVQISVSNKVYDGTIDASANGDISDNSQIISDEQVNLRIISANFNNASVGDNKNVTIYYFLDGINGLNYTTNQVSPIIRTANITPKPLILNISANDKVYDGTTGASAIVDISSGLVGSDIVDVQVDSAYFDHPSVGNNKNVNIYFSLNGMDAGNYTTDPLSPAIRTANITSALEIIDISGTFDVYDKEYDGTVEAEVSGAVVVNGKVEGDDVQILITKAEFVDPNVEENKVVWAKEYGLTGTSASKYNLVTVYPTLASISPRDISGTFDVYDKEYDGTVEVEVSGDIVVNGKVEGDDIQIILTKAEFLDSNAGEDKVVWAKEYGLTGTSVSNYHLVEIYPTLASISPRDVSGIFTVYNKEYDKNNNAIVSGDVIVDRLIEGDDFTIQITSIEFDDAKIENNKPVTVKIFSTSGADVNNYQVKGFLPTTASITPIELYIELNIKDKVYDGTTFAELSGNVFIDNDYSILSGEEVFVNIVSLAFESPEVGNDIKVIVINYNLTGENKDNYIVSSYSLNQIKGNILPAIISGTLVLTSDKNQYTYGDSIVLSVDVSGSNINGKTLDFYNQNGIIGSQIINNNFASFTTTDYQVSDSFSVKYNLISSNILSPTINKKEISQTFTVLSKEFDGTKIVPVYIQLLDVLSKDNGLVSVFNPYGIVESEQVGDNQAVKVYYGLTGSKSNNYQIPSLPLSSTADIYPGYVQLTIDFKNKIYDGTTTADVSGVTPLFILGDNSKAPYQIDSSFVRFEVLANFENDSIGTNKNITVNNVSIQGAWSSNLFIAETIAKKASILPKDISGLLYFEKIYDGNVIAHLKQSSFPEIITKDVSQVELVISNPNLMYGHLSKNVGETGIFLYSGQEIFDLSGSRSMNYRLIGVNKLGNILPYILNDIQIPIDNKIYDTTLLANLIPNQTITFQKVLETDVVSVYYDHWEFLNPNAGKEKTVIPIGLGLTGSDAINYGFGNLNLKSTIYPKDISGQFIAFNKYYDGNDKVDYDKNSLVLNGVYIQDLSDVSVLFKNPFFINSDAGEDKLVNVDVSFSVVFSGSKALNYNLKSLTSLATIYPLDISYQVKIKDKYFDKTKNGILDQINYSGISVFDSSFVVLDVSNIQFENSLIGQNKKVFFDLISSGSKSVNYNFVLDTEPDTEPRASILKPLTFTSPDEFYSEDYLGNDWNKTFGVTGQTPFTYTLLGQLPQGLSFGDGVVGATGSGATGGTGGATGGTGPSKGDISGSLLETGLFDFMVQASIPGIYTESKLYTLRVKPLVSIKNNQIFPLSTKDLPSGSTFLFKDPNLSTFYQNVGIYYSETPNESLILGQSIFNIGTQILIPNPKDYIYLFGQVSQPKSFYPNVFDMIVLKVLDKEGNIVSTFQEPIPMFVYTDSQPKPTLETYIASNPSKLSGLGTFKQKIGLKIEYEFQLIQGDGAHKIFLTDNVKGEMSESLIAVVEHLDQVDRLVLSDYLLTNQIRSENNYSEIVDEFKTFILQKFPDRPSNLRINQL